MRQRMNGQRPLDQRGQNQSGSRILGGRERIIKMPAVPVRMNSNAGKGENGKLVLVELQGKIECNSGNLSGHTLGELSLEQV